MPMEEYRVLYNAKSSELVALSVNQDVQDKVSRVSLELVHQLIVDAFVSVLGVR